MMMIELDVLERILRDGVSLNRAMLEAYIPELIAEIKRLRAELKEAHYAVEAKS